MSRRIAILLAAAALLPACAETRRTPAITPSAAPQAAAPAKPGILQQAGDTTWRVVTAPAHIFSQPKTFQPKNPESYDPPAATFIERNQPPIP